MPIGSTLQLNASIIPANATNQKLAWTSGYGIVAAVSSNGKVSALKVGKANIIVRTEDGSFRDTCIIEVVLKSAYNPGNKGNIWLFPNPASESVTVSGMQTPCILSLIDSSGRVLMEQACDSESKVIELGDIAQGMYYIRIKTAKEVTVKNIIIK